MTDDFGPNSEYEALHSINVEKLGLSDSTLLLVKAMGITSVGDCLDYHLHKHYAMIEAPLEYRIAMEAEVKTKLQELGYWVFYEKIYGQNE